MSVQPTPDFWAACRLGYVFRVHTHVGTSTHMINWLIMQFGPMSEGAWIDQTQCVCFVHESHAQLFDITWQ